STFIYLIPNPCLSPHNSVSHLSTFIYLQGHHFIHLSLSPPLSHTHTSSRLYLSHTLALSPALHHTHTRPSLSLPHTLALSQHSPCLYLSSYLPPSNTHTHTHTL